MTRKLLPTLGASAPPLVEANRRSLDPKAIRDDFLELLAEHDIQVLHEHRIASCEMDSGAIRTASFDLAPFDELGCPVAEPKEHDHLRVTAKVFSDASYEVDLMDRAGVPFRVGREAESEYDEELAGVREPMEITSLDPFVEPGNPDSGLLDWVENDHGKPIGSADDYSHLGYASARMESVFMICGESAGVAACQALKCDSSVQDIDVTEFGDALLAAAQKLNWDPEKDRSTASFRDRRSYSRLLIESDRDRDKAVSESEWNTGKPGWEWLFAKIDTNRDGNLSEDEYNVFQDYKAKHSDWAQRLRQEKLNTP